MVIGALFEPSTGDVLSINKLRVSFGDKAFWDAVLSKVLFCSVDVMGFGIPCPNSEIATMTATITPTPIPIDGR